MSHLEVSNNFENVFFETICTICTSKNIEYIFPCLNGTCLDCFKEFLFYDLKKYNSMRYSINIKFRCMFKCQCEISFEMIQNIILGDERLKTEYYDTLFLIYISNTPDIYNCPNNNCKNVNFLPNINAKTNKGDNNSLSLEMQECLYACSSCKTKIKLNNIINMKEPDFFLEYRNIIYHFVEFKSYIFKVYTSKICKKCNSFIEKIDGCNHITCNRCGYAFCYKCSDNWLNHKEKYCQGINCNLYQDSLNLQYLYFLFAYIFMVLFIRLIYEFPIILKFLWLMSKSFFFICYLGIDFSMVFMMCIQLFKMKNPRKFSFLLIGFFMAQFLEIYILSPPFSIMQTIIMKKFAWVLFVIFGLFQTYFK